MVKINKDTEGVKKTGGRPATLIHLLEKYRTFAPLKIVNKLSEEVYLRKSTLCTQEEETESIEDIFEEEFE